MSFYELFCLLKEQRINVPVVFPNAVYLCFTGTGACSYMHIPREKEENMELSCEEKHTHHYFRKET